MKLAALIVCVVLSLSGFSQNGSSSDFLSNTFHKERRAKLREKLPPKSVAVFFANATRNRSNDVDYVYHQDPDFYYFTGYREPDALLLIFKEPQRDKKGNPFTEIIFVRPKNEQDELWNGARLGPAGVSEKFGLSQAYANTLFKKFNVDFSIFESVLFTDFENDVRDNPADSSDLYSLIEQFKLKANYPSQSKGLAVMREPQKNNLNTTGLAPIMAALRGVKAPEEIALVKKAVNISCTAQREVMKAIKPGMSEREIQGIQEFVFKKYQAEDVGYPSIVGAGNNGCILHYEANNKPGTGPNEMVLMDLGAEYHGYSADITRTIPVSGKFSAEQKAIYELVLKAQEEGMKVCKAGGSFADINNATRKTITQGLLDLGITTDLNAGNKYYPHGCCHHIGLDVHDKGASELVENMIITIEPGIYIPDNSPCDRRWWGIAVRIEDNFLITKDGYVMLSALAPRKVEEIETLMKQPSALDDFVLPDLH